VIFRQSPPDDTLRAALDSVFAGPAYRWIDRPDPLRLLRDWAFRLSDWIAALREGNPLWYRALLIGLIGLLLVILGHAAWIFWQTLRGATRTDEAAAPESPISRRDARHLRADAEQAAHAGRYAEALRLGFHALVLELDAGGSVAYSSGKTPGEYAREARLSPTDRGRLSALVGSLYRHVYGAVPCTAEECGRWLAEARGRWDAAAP
jgi:hypothetical protein